MGKRIVPMTSAEAFAAVALAAVACDGSLGRDEVHALRRQLEYRSLYRNRSEAAMGDLFDALLHDLRDRGVMGLVDAALPRSARPSANRPWLWHRIWSMQTGQSHRRNPAFLMLWSRVLTSRVEKPPPSCPPSRH